MDGCQVCIGDKKAPKRGDESRGAGVKGVPSGGVGVEGDRIPPAFPSAFHGSESSNE